MRRATLILCLCAGLAACVTSPDLPPAERQAQGNAPRLVPISGLLDQAARPDDVLPVSLAAAPQARAAALRARASSLRGPVIAPSERARLLSSGPRLR
ncbi:hypothetical protein [Roseinatronobacter sp.]|uniref:hypothetical protein n=1 Tax=Roseinatronobacter sp. TaxID=1945755 RepID=UPI0025F52B09|nr:hypothetical protein [Roseibaca sp.]